MSTGAERFIDKLSEQGALPEAIVKKLWDKVANSSSVPSARALATFLVDKGHLTRDQADAALAASKPKRRPRPEPKKQNSSGAKSTPKKRSSRKGSGDPFSEVTDEPRSKSAKGDKKKGGKKYKKKTKGDNEFDTPLILLGGGGLIIGLLVCGGILFLLFSESGDEALKAARTAFEAGSYNQAVADYERYLEKFSSHEGRSEGRVTLGVARIRNISEKNSEARLRKAQQEVPLIEDEEEFLSAQEDLASLLPAIAKGLSQRADAAETLEDIGKYVGLTREALVLCANSKYLPSRLRDEAELNEIDQVLARIKLRQVALESLESTLDTMQDAVAAGDTRTAYAAHAAFVKAHPEKASDAGLIEAVAATSEAEQASIRFIEERVAPKRTEAKTGVSAAVATAERRKSDPAPARGVTVVRFQGGAYAFDRRDGRLRWRRPLGASIRQIEPTLLGDDCLLVDSARQELVRVNAATGELRWRTPLGDDVAQPMLLGAGGNVRVLAAGVSGRLHVINAETGEGLGYVEFAQALRSSPTASADGKRFYLVGDHSSVYSFDAASLDCLGVYYLGHAGGTVVSPPTMVLDRVVVVENDGAATSRMHVFGLDESGAVAEELEADKPESLRLSGLVTRKPDVFGKRFAVSTESGGIGVYEASSEADAAAVTLLAQRDSRRRLRSTPYTAVVEQQLWVAGTGLARYSIQPSGRRLPVREIDEPFRGDTFVHPLRVDDGVVIHVRRRRGRAGATVACSDAKTGAVYWETDVAVPAAGPPVSAASGGGLLYATASGAVFVIDAEAMRTGVADRTVAASVGPAKAADQSNTALLDAGQSVADGGLFASSSSRSAVGVATGETASVQRLALPGALSGPPTRFGDGWLAALSVGQVMHVDGSTGEPLAAPFQPELAPRATLDWRAPALTTVDGRPAALVTDGRSQLYALGVITSPAPHLAPLAEHRLDRARFVSRVAVSGSTTAVAIETSGRRVEVGLFGVETLERLGSVSVDADLVWGPYAAGSLLLLATADNKLIALNPTKPGEVIWSTPAEASQLTGEPASNESGFELALRRGVLQSRNAADGSVVKTTPLGQAVAGGSVVRGGRRLLTAYDGALLIIDPAGGEIASR